MEEVAMQLTQVCTCPLLLIVLAHYETSTPHCVDGTRVEGEVVSVLQIAGSGRGILPLQR